MSGVRILDSTYSISSLIGTNAITVNVDGTVAANEVIVNEFIISDGTHSTTLLPQAINSSNNLTLSVTNDLTLNTAILAVTATGAFGLNATTQPIALTSPSIQLNPVTPGSGLEILYPHSDIFTIAGQGNVILESTSSTVALQAPTSISSIAPTFYIAPASGDGALTYNGSGNFIINSSGNLTFNATSTSFPTGAFTIGSLTIHPTSGDGSIAYTGSGNLNITSSGVVNVQKDLTLQTGNLNLTPTTTSNNGVITYTGSGFLSISSPTTTRLNAPVQINAASLTLNNSSSVFTLTNAGTNNLNVTSSTGNILVTTPVLSLTTSTSVTAITPTLFLSPVSGDCTINYNGVANLNITSAGQTKLTATSISAITSTLFLSPAAGDGTINYNGIANLNITSAGQTKLTATSVSVISPTLFLTPSSGDGTINYNGSGNLIVTSAGHTTMTSTAHFINAPITIQQSLIGSKITGTTTATYTVTNSIVQSLSVGGATTITKFDAGTLNQIIVVLTPSDGNTTIQHNSNIFLTGTADIILTQRSAIGFICTDATGGANVWMELFRSIK